MVHSFTEAASILLQLKELGVRIAIDDFGTGYSCLAYLPRLPLDELKIDRAFVRRLHESKDDRRLVQGIIDLAHNLELEAVAEGVEDEGARQVLQDMGCDLIQGHLLTPALDAEAFIDWVRKRNP
jgi:EAL domain-containing protein (putative c-di-GMP-specific phosphodiesterase class I)